jgi:pSer/pThr/pTyr-binding forkhead associated (FHA) protein
VFVQTHGYPFLLADGAIERPQKPGKTASYDLLQSTGPGTANREKGTLMLLAVRKVIGTFPNMITLGRTSNNDIVVPDVSISKFHAWFQRLGDRVEVGDAGSKNGTAVNGETLPPRGTRVALKSGDRIRFARIEVTFLDAGSAWDAVDRRRGPGG